MAMNATIDANPSAVASHREASSSAPAPYRRLALPVSSRSAYLSALTWCFTFFSSVRILAYLPTLSAILQSEDASQHSLWTWLTWLGSNLTMALWLYEQGGQRANRAVLVNVGNAVMCGAIVALILFYR